MYTVVTKLSTSQTLQGGLDQGGTETVINSMSIFEFAAGGRNVPYLKFVVCEIYYARTDIVMNCLNRQFIRLFIGQQLKITPKTLHETAVRKVAYETVFLNYLNI